MPTTIEFHKPEAAISHLSGQVLNYARFHLGHIEPVAHAIRELHGNPGAVEARVEEFEAGLSLLREIVDPQQRLSNLSSPLLMFRKKYMGLELGSLELAYFRSKESQRVNKTGGNVFRSLAKHLNSDQYSALDLIDSGEQATILIVNGYGELLTRIYKKPELMSDFPHALYEVLANKRPNSQLVSDHNSIIQKIHNSQPQE